MGVGSANRAPFGLRSLRARRALRSASDGFEPSVNHVKILWREARLEASRAPIVEADSNAPEREFDLCWTRSSEDVAHHRIRIEAHQLERSHENLLPVESGRSH